MAQDDHMAQACLPKHRRSIHKLQLKHVSFKQPKFLQLIIKSLSTHHEY